MKRKINRIISGLMMAIMLFATTGFSNVYAAEVEPSVGETEVQPCSYGAKVQPYAGIETFRLNKNYHVGSFTFTQRNTTPRKTVEGRYLYTYLDMTRASSDLGVASTPIKVTVKILDASTLNQIGGGATYIIQPGSNITGGFETDLGYAGRQIYIKFEATSYNGATNGYNRTVYVQDFMVNTTNIQGTYFDS